MPSIEYLIGNRHKFLNHTADVFGAPLETKRGTVNIFVSYGDIEEVYHNACILPIDSFAKPIVGNPSSHLNPPHSLPRPFWRAILIAHEVSNKPKYIPYPSELAKPLRMTEHDLNVNVLAYTIAHADLRGATHLALYPFSATLFPVDPRNSLINLLEALREYQQFFPDSNIETVRFVIPSLYSPAVASSLPQILDHYINQPFSP